MKRDNGTKRDAGTDEAADDLDISWSEDGEGDGLSSNEAPPAASAALDRPTGGEMADYLSYVLSLAPSKTSRRP